MWGTLIKQVRDRCVGWGVLREGWNEVACICVFVLCVVLEECILCFLGCFFCVSWVLIVLDEGCVAVCDGLSEWSCVLRLCCVVLKECFIVLFLGCFRR